MKKLLVIAITLCTLTSIAQQEHRRGQRFSKDARERRADISPEDMAKFQSKQMTLRLDLTDQQQQQVETVLTAHLKKGKAKREALKASDKKPTQEERKQLRLDRMDAQIALKREMKSILNDEQYKRYERSLEKRKNKGSKGKSQRGPRGRH